MGSFICYIFPALFYLMHMHSGAEYRRRAKVSGGGGGGGGLRCSLCGVQALLSESVCLFVCVFACLFVCLFGVCVYIHCLIMVENAVSF